VDIPEELPDINALLEKEADNPTLLNPVERVLLRERLFRFYRFPEAIEFPPPFEKCFAYGWQLLNLKHPAAQALLRLGAAMELPKKRGTLPEDQLGHLRDALNLLPSHDSPLSDWEEWSNALRRIWSLAREVQLFDVGEIEDLVPAPEEFVPGTVVFDEDSRRMASNLELRLKEIVNIRQFGQPLT